MAADRPDAGQGNFGASQWSPDPRASGRGGLVMDMDNRLAAALAYVVVACMLGAIAFVGIGYYSATRDGHGLLEADSTGGTAPEAGGRKPPRGTPRGAHVDRLFAQRSQIRRLQALLDQKTKLLEKKTALLEQKTAEQAALKKELDEAIELLEMLAAQNAQEVASSPEDEEANGELQENLERLKKQRKAAETQGQEQEAELKTLIDDLATTDQEISLLKQQTELEFNVLEAEKEALEAVATQMLVNIGAEAVPLLVEQLASPRADIRRWAATVLGQMGPDATEAIPPLISLLSDPDPRVRTAAQHALDLISPPE